MLGQSWVEYTCMCVHANVLIRHVDQGVASQLASEDTLLLYQV